MGKCKRRTLNKGVLNTSKLSRESALIYIIEQIRKAIIDKETKDYISLFGITTEELAEAGATYEEVAVLKKYII